MTNFSRAKFKVLDASFQLNNRHIFLVSDITLKVQKYLITHPGVETVKVTPVCYLKSMEKDGPEIALHCLIKSMVNHFFILCFSYKKLSSAPKAMNFFFKVLK